MAAGMIDLVAGAAAAARRFDAAIEANLSRLGFG